MFAQAFCTRYPGFLGILRGKNLRKLNPDPNISREYTWPALIPLSLSLSPCVHVHIFDGNYPRSHFPKNYPYNEKTLSALEREKTIIKLEDAFFLVNFKSSACASMSERSQNRQVNDSKVRNWLPRVLLKLEGHLFARLYADCGSCFCPLP